MLDSRRLAAAALLLLPAGLVAYFAFNSGGFYPEPPAYAALILCVLLLVRSLAGSPFEGAGWLVGSACALFALYALLVLASQAWSHAPGRAAVEFDRALMYLAALVLFGSIGRARLRLVWLLRGLFAVIVVICTCGLITRVLPHLWPINPTIANNRLSFPVTYWNALGVLGALGLVLSLHFSSDRREHPVTHALAAAASPILASTLLFTFSRGAIGVAAIGLVAYTLVGRPRLWLSAVIAIAPPTAVALKFAYDANLLATVDPTTAGAIAQGHRVAVAVVICALATLLLRGLLTVMIDPILIQARLPAGDRRRVLKSAWAAFGVAVVIALAALNGTIRHEYHGFISPAVPGAGATDLRARLTDPGNDGRIPVWRVAWHRFEAHPVLGNGAGTFQNSWAQYRTVNESVVNAHSLYLENLDEFGVVGFVLLVTVVVLILATAAARARGPDRPVYAVCFAVLLGWAIHAGVDWDWQMPVLTVIFFTIGGMVLARPAPTPASEPAASDRWPPSSFMRAMMGIGCVVLAVAPAYLWLSQRDLNTATAAYRNGDCRVAARAAMSSISIMGSRPEPYEVLSYCDVNAHTPRLAVAAMNKAVSLDPDNWNYRFGLAIMRAADGLDPRGAARKALLLNPRSSVVRGEFMTLTKAKPSQWSRDGYRLAQSVNFLENLDVSVRRAANA